MNKLKQLPLFIILFGFAIFTSCTVEPYEGPTSNSNPTNGGSQSTGDYWPMKVNNQWIYKQDGVNLEASKILSTEQINGATYYKYNNFLGTGSQGSGFSSETWSKKAGGDYYYRFAVTIPSQGGSPGISVSPNEILILKDYLAVGGTWEQNFTQITTITGFPPVNSAVNIQGKILEKDISITVNGINYTNVIKAEVVQNTQGEVNTNYYWFAKNIGLIKAQNIIQGSPSTETELVSSIIN
jgi:hypothetical protein